MSTFACHEFRPRLLFALVIMLGLMLVGCSSYRERSNASHEQWVAGHTATLREAYPTGMSKEEVQSRWGQMTPDFSAIRPDKGWGTYQYEYLANKFIAMESSTGKQIESVDRYWGPNGLFSLCYCWYFYDGDGKIVDVEWQYKSD